MAEARVNLDMRHALDRTRAASERELGRTPLVEELRRRRRADGVLGAVGPLGGRQAHGNPARWPRRALGSVARCRSMPASRGLLGPPGVSWGLLGSPGVSESPGAAGGGDREVGGGCRRKLWAGWACGRSDGAGWNVNLPPLTLRPATHLTQPTASQRVSASGGPAAAVG